VACIFRLTMKCTRVDKNKIIGCFTAKGLSSFKIFKMKSFITFVFLLFLSVTVTCQPVEKVFFHDGDSTTNYYLAIQPTSGNIKATLVLLYPYRNPVAFIIAIPVAWWPTHNSLQNFAYHTNLSCWIFLSSGMIMITAAVVILCIRAGRAAMANPVKSLRSE
jgi:hypothetical protein